MIVVGQKLPIFAFLIQGALLISGAAAGAESDSERAPRPPRRLPQKSSEVARSIEPLHEVDRIFLDDGDSVFTRPLSNPGRSLRDETSLFRLVDYDVPPLPSVEEVAPDGSSDQPRPLYDQPLYVPPMASQPAPCDTCDPVFGGVVRDACCYDVENWSPIARWFGIGSDRDPHACSDVGIGHERVMFAPFQIDTTQPTTFTMVRWDSGFHLQTPDRAEYFWSKSGKGPAFSPNSINYQEMRFISESAVNDAFSVQTEIPVRFIEPETGGSTSGIGDMKVATKARLVNGKNWQITQIFRTYIPIGTASKGVGTGHVSLEPGALARYEISPSTFIHGEVEFLIPIAADQGFASNVLTYGVGVSHVLYETNNFAIIPAFEMVNFDFLTGQKTYNGIPVNANGETAINLIPGARFVVGPKGDLGLFEFGVSNMIGIGDRYANDILRFDFKLIY